MIYKGGCHCGDVKFQVEASETIDVYSCNCSICSKTGFLHLISPLSKFKLQSGSDAITTYTFNTGVAKHTFCKICGIKSFYTPQTNNIQQFDGQNWEQHVLEIADRDQEN